MKQFAPMLVLLVLCGGVLYAQQTVTGQLAATPVQITLPATAPDPVVTKLVTDLAQLRKELDALKLEHDATKGKLVRLGEVDILSPSPDTVKLKSVMQ